MATHIVNQVGKGKAIPEASQSTNMADFHVQEPNKLIDAPIRIEGEEGRFNMGKHKNKGKNSKGRNSISYNRDSSFKVNEVRANNLGGGFLSTDDQTFVFGRPTAFSLWAEPLDKQGDSSKVAMDLSSPGDGYQTPVVPSSSSS